MKKTKETKMHFDEYAGSILKSHEAGQNSVYMLIENSLNAQRGQMKQKLEKRKKAYMKRLFPDKCTPERPSVTNKRKSISHSLANNIEFFLSDFKGYGRWDCPSSSTGQY